MKNILIAVILGFSAYAQAENYELCYNDARQSLYSPKDSSMMCRGLISDTCYGEARKSSFSIKDSSDICRNVVSETCYLEARNLMRYPIKTAADLCRGLINKACYTEVRKNVPTIADAVAICRAGVTCQGK